MHLVACPIEAGIVHNFSVTVYTSNGERAKWKKPGQSGFFNTIDLAPIA